MEDRLKFFVKAFDMGNKIAVAVQTPDGHRHAVAQPRAIFSRHKCKAALKAWAAEKHGVNASG